MVGLCPCSCALASQLTLLCSVPAVSIAKGSPADAHNGSRAARTSQVKQPSTGDGAGQEGWSWDYLLV